MPQVTVIVPPELAATAQSFYAAAATASVALLTLVSGPLYGRFGGAAFVAMAVVSGLALPLVRGLSRAAHPPSSA